MAVQQEFKRCGLRMDGKVTAGNLRVGIVSDNVPQLTVEDRQTLADVMPLSPCPKKILRRWGRACGQGRSAQERIAAGGVKKKGSR